jgi:hypothetical protein
MSLKSENKVSLKGKIIEERKDSDSTKGEKKSIKVGIEEKKIRMRKEESVENIGKHLSFYTKERERSRVLIFMTCLLFYLCIRRHILTLTILILLFLVLLYLCFRILRMIQDNQI